MRRKQDDSNIVRVGVGTGLALVLVALVAYILWPKAKPRSPVAATTVPPLGATDSRHASDPLTAQIRLSAFEISNNMPENPVFLPNPKRLSYPCELSCDSRLKTLNSVSNFVCRARAAGFAVAIEGEATMLVTAGKGHVSETKTPDTHFTTYYSEWNDPLVGTMTKYGPNREGLEQDIWRVLGSSSPELSVLAQWSDRAKYPILGNSDSQAEALVQSAAMELLRQQIPDFEKWDYRVEREYWRREGGTPLPFVEVHLVSRVLRMHGVEQDVTILARVGGQDLLNIGRPELMHYEDADLFSRPKDLKDLPTAPKPNLPLSHRML